MCFRALFTLSVHRSTSDPAPLPMTKKFQHERLPDPRNHLRLLQIISVNEKRDVPVHCKLTTWPVATAPEYTAISYTWGDPRQLTVMLVNGRPMEVRCNCEYVLKQAWWQKGGGYVWVDAICINQTDNDEKSSQVAMMGNVYDRASQVLACVGRHEDDSHFLFEVLHKQQHWWRRFHEGPWDVSNSRAQSWRLLMRKSTIVRLFNALQTFFGRSYFHRVWVLQELFFGKEIQVCCEHDTINMSLLRESFLVFERWILYSPEHLQFFNSRLWWQIREVDLLLNIGAHSSPAKIHLDAMMRHVGTCQCEDPRDRIFGILSIIRWNSRTPIQVDYSRDGLDLAIKLLIYLGHAGKLESLLRVAIYIAQYLDLIYLPPTQERRSTCLTALPAGPGLTLGMCPLQPTKFWGHRLCYQDTRWRIQTPHSKGGDWPRTGFWSPENVCGDYASPIIKKWVAGHSFDILSADIILPQEAQPEDWFLAPSHIDVNHATSDALLEAVTCNVALIARTDGDGHLQLVGKALSNLWKKCPTKFIWEKTWATKGVEYDVYLDHEDVFTLAYSLNWLETLDFRKEHGVWLKQRAGRYFETRLRGERSCSYAVPVVRLSTFPYGIIRR